MVREWWGRPGLDGLMQEDEQHSAVDNNGDDHDVDNDQEEDNVVKAGLGGLAQVGLRAHATSVLRAT